MNTVKVGYQQTGIGVIPEDWEALKISDILKIGGGKDYKHLKSGNIPVFGTGGKMLSVDNYLYDGDSVCIGRKGTIDRPLFLSGKFWTVDTLFYTHSFNNVLPRFVYYSFLRINWKKYNEASGVPSLSKATIESIKIPLPPKPEQQKIVDILTTWDKAIEKQSALISQKQQIKKGLMQKIFSQEVRFKANDGSNFPDWEDKKLGDVGKIKKGSQLNKIELTNTGDYPAINGGINPSGYTDKWNTEEDTITISEGGNSCGYVNLITSRFWSGGHCYSVNELKDNTLNNFLFQYLKFNELLIMRLRVGSGLPNIQKKDIDSFKVDLPHIVEQGKISNLLTLADDDLEKLKQELVVLKTQKKGLMQKLLTGQVRVTIN
jgi:type I restriction enzyme, S subunit